MQKILIVDDEIDLCELIGELAEEAGLAVTTVSDSGAVADTIANFAPDALMLDLMMPGMDGVELLRMLAEQLKGTKIALMSGSDSRVLNSARRLASAHGLNIIATLEKPLEISLIRQTIAALTTSEGGQGANNVTAADLSQAITGKKMQIAVQPIMDMTGKPVALEALPRWILPDGSELAACDFIDKARADGLLGQLTHDMLETAFATLKATNFAGMIAFNIMPEQLADPYFVTRLAEIATHHEMRLSRVMLELSEMPLQSEVANILPVMQTLQDKGVRIWLNDYMGKLPLGDLMQLPLSGMKLSRHLVLNLPAPAAQATIVGAIALANARQLPVYAVAIETQEQHDMLMKMGVQGYQGTFAAAPMSFPALTEWLAAR